MILSSESSLIDGSSALFCVGDALDIDATTTTFAVGTGVGGIGVGVGGPGVGGAGVGVDVAEAVALGTEMIFPGIAVEVSALVVPFALPLHADKASRTTATIPNRRTNRFNAPRLLAEENQRLCVERLRCRAIAVIRSIVRSHGNIAEMSCQALEVSNPASAR